MGEGVEETDGVGHVGQEGQVLDDGLAKTVDVDVGLEETDGLGVGQEGQVVGLGVGQAVGVGHAGGVGQLTGVVLE